MPSKRPPTAYAPPKNKGEACHRCRVRRVRCTGTDGAACKACLRTAKFRGHDLSQVTCAYNNTGHCSEEGTPNTSVSTRGTRRRMGRVHKEASPASPTPSTASLDFDDHEDHATLSSAKPLATIPSPSFQQPTATTTYATLPTPLPLVAPYTASKAVPLLPSTTLLPPPALPLSFALPSMPLPTLNDLSSQSSHSSHISSIHRDSSPLHINLPAPPYQPMPVYADATPLSFAPSTSSASSNSWPTPQLQPSDSPSPSSTSEDSFDEYSHEDFAVASFPGLLDDVYPLSKPADSGVANTPFWYEGREDVGQYFAFTDVKAPEQLAWAGLTNEFWA